MWQEAASPSPVPALTAALLSLLPTFLLVATRPYFHDETSTWFFAAGSTGHLWTMLRQDVHPPLYFLIAHVLFHLGMPLMALRVLSAVAMAGAVYLFTRLLGRGAMAWPVALVVGTSPFLAFTGYFARYYSLVALLLVAWAGALLESRRGGPGAVRAGVLGSVLVLVNYPAALLVCVATSVFAITHRAERRGAVAYLLPVATFVLLLPLLLVQVQSEIASRVGGTNLWELMVGIVRTSGYAAYCLSASDGLPPWSVAGPVVALAGVLLWLRGALAWLRRPGGWGVLAAVLLLIAAAVLVGAVTLRGPAFIFFPPRFAWLAFPWFLVLLGPPDSEAGPPRWVVAALIVLNAVGLGGLLAGGTTNWAYVVPSADIARQVKQATRDHPRAILYIPQRSFGNILWELTVDQGWSGRVNDCAADADRLIVIEPAGSALWPPPQAQEQGSDCVPGDDWVLVDEDHYIHEDVRVRAAKQRVMGRESEEYKLAVRVYDRSGSGAASP